MDIKRTITQLTDELGEERVLTRTAIGADYCHDEYPGGSYAPDAVIEAAPPRRSRGCSRSAAKTAFSSPFAAPAQVRRAARSQ